MTKFDLFIIREAIDNVKNQEQQYCREFNEWNPKYAKERTRNSEIFCAALEEAWIEIQRLSKESEAEIKRMSNG